MMYENDMPALEEMRQQLDLLKKKLDNQEIVNKKMLQQAMRKELDHLNRMGSTLTLVGILVAITVPMFFYYGLGASVWFCGATFLMLVFCAYKTCQYHTELRRIDLATVPLVQVGKQVATFRNQYKNWERIAIPMILVWLLWCAYEVYKVMGELAMYMWMGMAVGALIGGLVGTRINKKVIRSADSLLEQIREYEVK